MEEGPVPGQGFDAIGPGRASVERNPEGSKRCPGARDWPCRRRKGGGACSGSQRGMRREQGAVAPEGLEGQKRSQGRGRVCVGCVMTP